MGILFCVANCDGVIADRKDSFFQTFAAQNPISPLNYIFKV